MIAKNIRFKEFEHGVSIEDMTLSYDKGSYRLYTYDLDGALCGTLMSSVDFNDDEWNGEDLDEVDIIYIAECDCSSIKNLWIGDDGNLYYPDIDEIFDSLKVLRDLVECKQ